MYRNFLRTFFILGPLVILFASSYASPEGKGKIEGFVFDSQNNEPLPGANVVIEGTRYGAATDLKGKFVILQVPSGNYKLIVSYIGYRKKIVDITLAEDQTLNEVIKLDFQIIEGQVVEVTAQAEGQLGAINQQLSSNTIANIVSQARIRELPDVNAAESIGRLPGVAIQRSGGEANKISIRGLSPKYNTVTVNGVRVPSTDGVDRSVDLSLISSTMLDGIELKKAITPDMDADALGGTVDLRLKEAPDQLSFNLSGQSGYNRLQDYYGNYNFVGSVSNRFFDGRLGVIAGFNKDDYDRSADKFSGSYRQVGQGVGATNAISAINLREENVDRGRTGGSALIDYRLSNGKITANSFYNRLKWDGLYRINDLNVNDTRHHLYYELRGGTTSLFTGGAGIEQDFGWLSYDFGLAKTASRNENPNEKQWHFTREGGSIGSVPPDALPTEIPGYATNDSTRIGIQDIYTYNTNREEDQTTLQLNIKMPVRFAGVIDGYLKTGGKFRWLDRANDQTQYGRNGLYYGNNNGPNTILTALDRAIPEWGVDNFVRTYGVLGVSLFQTDYHRSNFLNGDYPLGFAADFSMLERMSQVLDASGEFDDYAIGSLGSDYDGEESYQAGYVMGEFNMGKNITFLPGIRYERDYSKYHGQRFRQAVRDNRQAEPNDYRRVEIERDNDFWLPMAHLTLQPKDWMKVRLAYTETLIRPDYNQYAPITWINSEQTYISATNSKLRPAESRNYDASVSVYDDHIGLFTVSGFYKNINDLIISVNHPINTDIINESTSHTAEINQRIREIRAFLTDNLNIPDGTNPNDPNDPANWLTRSIQYGTDTYINNPFEATIKGFELEWQTHFWYLPSFLHGIVLNVNYSRIYSETERELFFLLPTNRRKPLPGPPQYYRDLVDSSRVSRLPDQPAHIANITLGYDFKGFSGRLSFLYQTDRVASIGTEQAQDTFSGDYSRWDLTLQQKLGQTGLQFFANLSNLNERPDKNFRGGASTNNPTYIEYYGFTMDVGARYRF